MKCQATILLALMAALAMSKAEDSPSRPPAPTPSGSEMEEPALPTPEGAPSNPGPGLLPESGELPACPPAELPAKLSSTPASSQQGWEKEGRFDEIRTLAMSSPRAAYLLKRAKDSSNSVSRRSYLRAYYITVATRMRKLDPKLKSSIKAYEEEKIHEASGVRTSTVGTSSHHTRRHQTASHEVHHRLHRAYSVHSYRRMIMIDDPYAAGFSPYGPPVVLYPW